ncbi:MAG: heme ABC exporter ATP-binding protein CcmA [Chloroflexi bacterium]|nr:heme ABC exporter ATP-binding protein CcmA [Chloroflexota bacterium]MDA1271158.1 heme ABC exporter ATP-binding protein CcmA [Chloroflexota bacterium]PKB58693.1 MAG: heme ABC exporter, ATP-binding protein CcmA [SAR202 cluster bacterium Casp-Chloro-G2]
MTTLIGEAVQVRQLEKSFGEWPVLWDLDLSVPWGQTLVLFGANGAGKTTLLRILATHVRPDHGSVAVAGHNLRARPDAVRRRIGVVGHRSLLYDDLTCQENLVYYSRLFGLKDHKPRVDEVLEKVKLGDRAGHLVRTLSNGMQKRAAIARAILHQPDVLLMDEPETGLDRESVAILDELLAEWTASGRSVVMTTHDLDLGLSWGHRAGVLRGGKVHFPGTDSHGGKDENGDGAIRQAVTAALEAGR